MDYTSRANKTVLITGATGNVGIELIRSLNKLQHQLDIIAGVRDLKNGNEKLAEYDIRLEKFDFQEIESYQPALKNCDILFLLRPPRISEVEKYFKPLINIARAENIKHIVFLSVQGVENSSIIPHHKIEKLIIASKISYTFLRPGYFMQNFSTSLRNDLVKNKIVFLPAGNAKFTLIDVRDIGAVAAEIIANTAMHINRSYELTCGDKLSFKEMADKLSEVLATRITYQSPNLLNFYLKKRKEKMPVMLILVMIMLHYFPGFQKEPAISDCVEKITGRQPISFSRFISDNKTALT